MLENIQIRLCQTDEIERFKEFVETYWGRDHILARDEALLRWQFEPNRGGRQEVPGLSVLLAWQGTRIVGMVGIIPFDLNIRGETIQAIWFPQFLTVPDLRGQGVGGQLIQAINDMGYELICGLGYNDRVGNIYTRLGFEMLPDVPRWIGIFDLDKTVSLLKEGESDGERDALGDRCTEYLVATETDRSEEAVVEVVGWSGPLGASWDSTWSEIISPLMVGCGKDSAYLNWRYAEHPTFTYETRLAQEKASGRALGLTVFRVEQIRDRDERILRVVEFLSTAEAEGPLAQAVVQAARDHGVIFADFYCTSKKATEALESIGFKRSVSSESGPHFPSLFQPLEFGEFSLNGTFWLSDRLRDQIGELLKLDDFYVTKTDSDQDRPH